MILPVWIVTYKTEQQDVRIGAVYLDLDEAKAECERLENANSYANVYAMPVLRHVHVEAAPISAEAVSESITYWGGWLNPDGTTPNT